MFNNKSQDIVPELESENELDSSALIENLKNVRMDLLPVLYALLKTGGVTSAARLLGLTQSAVSQHLKTLRNVFNDGLLVPVGRTLQRTEFADSLEEPLSRLMEDIDQIFGPRPIFNPLTEEVNIIISTADYICSLLAPRLVSVCSTIAPKVTFEFVPATSTINVQDLSSVDFFIAPRSYGETFGKRTGVLTLWRDRILCIAGLNNHSFPAAMQAEQISQFRQVGYRTNPLVPERIRRLIHPTGSLETKRVCLAPSFMVLGEIVERSDCIAFLPRILANEMTRRLQIKTAELVDMESEFEVCAFLGSLTLGQARTWLGQTFVTTYCGRADS